MFFRLLSIYCVLLKQYQFTFLPIILKCAYPIILISIIIIVIFKILSILLLHISLNSYLILCEFEYFCLVPTFFVCVLYNGLLIAFIH